MSKPPWVSAMLATSVGPLNVQIHKAPNKAWKTAEATQRLITHILSQLKYGGTWLLSLSQQLTKREDFKFKLIERRGPHIICRTKPGDNGTCWQIMLAPPKGYMIDQIFSDLRMVPPNGEMVKIPTVRPINDGNKLTIPVVKPIQLSVPVKEVLPKVDLPKVESPKVESPKVESPKAESPKAELPPVAPIPAIVSPSPEPIVAAAKPAASKRNELELGTNVETVGDNPKALINGLIAVCFGVSPDDGSVYRQTAIKLLVSELNLAALADKGVYKDPVKAASVIMSSLCDKGYFGRYGAPRRKTTVVRETTKGYLLTPHGRNKLESLRSSLSPEVLNRLFKPNDLGSLALPTKPVLAEKLEPVVEKPAEKTEPFVQKYDQMAPLMKQYKERQRSYDDCLALVNELTKQNKTNENVYAKTERAVALAEQELLKLKSELESATTTKVKSADDLLAAEQLRDLEKIALEQVRDKLQKIIAS